MTHPNHQTNGASLEDCHTNFFALTELCGIKWRKLTWVGGTSTNGGGGANSNGPLGDPVLSSYARCLAADLLCVWRRVAHSPPPPAPPAQEEGAPLHHHPPPPPPPPPPPLSLDSAKELWIFWYGEEPNLDRLVSKELIDSGGGDQGSWELGLSYECRSLLFKALHNLIERCLLSKDFVRLGKWFVQPYDGDDEDMANSCSNLSFSFAFFVHGESTVCASMDVRLHPPVKKLSLSKPPPPYTKVILAPFGLAGNLVSVSGNSEVVEAWRTFYPLEESGTVEVAVGGVRMHYPAPYVLLTHMDATSVRQLSNNTNGCGTTSSLLSHRTLTYLGLGQPEPAVSPLESGLDIKPPLDMKPNKEWDFVDPQRRTFCQCSKCWRGGGRRSTRRGGTPFHRRHTTPQCLSVSGSQGTPMGSGGGEGSPGSCGGGSPGGGVSPAPLPPVSTPTGVPLLQPIAPLPATPQPQPPPTGLPHTPAPTPPHFTPHTPRTPHTPKQSQSEIPLENLKRPILSLQETELDPLEEERPLDRLYDYSNIHAWLNHPVKKLKTDEGDEWVCFEEMGGVDGWGEDLYAGHTHTKMAPLEALSAHQAPPSYLNTEIKREVNQDESNKENKNLFTSDGLQASYKDLDQIFDNSDDTSGDETLHVHTPPGSNKSSGGCVGNDDLGNGKSAGGGLGGGRVPLVRPEELSKMYPTPPSQEPSLQQASPSAFTLSELETTITNNTCISRCGSPPDEPIEDWSYVFKPPTICKYVGSSKYSALTGLLGSVEPSHCIYRPLWQQNNNASANNSNQTSNSSSCSNNNTSASNNTTSTDHRRGGSTLNAASSSLHQPPRTPHHGQLHSVGSTSQPASVGCVSGVGSAAPPLPAPSPAPGMEGGGLHQSLPQEECSLLLNLLLADTAINIFRDHNFDSCTMCVCNAGPVVGNIRGADSGVYLWGGSPMSPDSPSQSPTPPSPPEEEPIACRCGFSAVVNRRLAYKAGLFYEDEMEITGVAEDPVEYKGAGGVFGDGERSSGAALVELVREQCSVMNNSASALQQCATQVWEDIYSMDSISSGVKIHVLEYSDCSDAAALALEAAAGRHGAQLHKWPFLLAPAPGAGRHVIRLMRSLQPLLQEAIQKKCSTKMWDAVTGPLTWRQFHRLAGRGTEDLCEPQPVPHVLVGHDRDWVALSPYALNYWDKLLLEPYSYSRDTAYVVLLPDTPTIVSKVGAFFRDLSAAYEQCRLGRHAPLARVAKDGLLRVGRSSRSEPLDEWFNALPDNATSEILKLYAQMCRGVLGPLLSGVQLDHTLLDGDSGNITRRSPPVIANNNNCTSQEKPAPSPMPPPDHPPTPTNTNSEHDGENNCASGGSGANTSIGDGVSGEGGGGEEEPCLVIYLVEPGTGAEKRLCCLAMLRAGNILLSMLPDHIRPNVSVQLISWESICDAEKNNNNHIGGSAKMGVVSRRSSTLRSLALSVFSQCKRQLQHTSNIKSLTGFGTAANADLFLKSKDEKNRMPYRLYVPPYILAPPRPLKDIAETFGQASPEACSVLYLSYCLSADQSWLLGVCTDGRGELLETVTINIDVPGRSRRRRAPPARRLGLTKLMDFTLGVMSQSVQPWRLVVGRIGRIGHGELKGWSWLLSKKNLLKASQSLREVCASCSLLYPANTPCILSACLVSTEPDSALRLLADQFTPDERFSQASIASHLSTPQDVSCTHILVFPTSATTTSSQTAFQEQHINDPDLGDDDLLEVFNGDDMPEGIDGMDGDLRDIWNWTSGNSPGGSPGDGQEGMMGDGVGGSASRPGSHDRGNSMLGPHGSPMDDGNNRCMGGSGWEEVGTLLQQPLALGYLVSTAPLGRMPGWWWAACPHALPHCPAFLKTALHLHCPSVQAAEDLLNPPTHTQPGPPPHPLDSTYTTDVLRYVLEGYNALSWLALDCSTQDRLSCLPAHVQVLMQLYHLTAAFL